MPDKISGESKTFLSPREDTKKVPEVDLRRKIEMLKAKMKKSLTAEEEMMKKLFAKQGSAVEQWERELQTALDSQIERKPVVEDQNFTYVNPMKNPNPEIKSTANVTLRTSRDILFMDQVMLVRCDPSFMSPNEIRCRSPGCNKTKKRHPVSSRSMISKEDLYLCTSHRKLVENDVTKLCAAKGMDVSKKYCPEDFEGYISMIGLLESAYFHSLKSSPLKFANAVTRRKKMIMSEVFINLRNYLMITNVLLNPDDENLLTAVTRPMEVYLEILRILRNDGENIVQRLAELVVLLRAVIRHVLFAFGIIYSWVDIEELNNDGAKIGAFVGGFFGMLGFAAGPEVGVFTTIFGSVFGGLAGGGVQTLVNRQRREQRQADEGLRRYRRYVEMHRIQEQERRIPPLNPAQDPDDDVDDADSGIFSITGSVHGDLNLNFFPLG